jgi:hypothetical protein
VDAGALAERQIGANPTVSGEDTELFLHGPADVVCLVRAVVCTVRRTIQRQTGNLPTEGQAFDAMLEHALAIWGDNAPVRAAHRVFARDGWRCTGTASDALRFDLGLRRGPRPAERRKGMEGGGNGTAPAGRTWEREVGAIGYWHSPPYWLVPHSPTTPSPGPTSHHGSVHYWTWARSLASRNATAS